MLPGVGIVLPPSQGVELAAVAAFEDAAVLHYQHLVGTADGGEGIFRRWKFGKRIAFPNGCGKPVFGFP